MFPYPMFICVLVEPFPNKAAYRIRTDDLLITNQLHYHCAKTANGSGGIRTPVAKGSRFTVCPRCPLEYTPVLSLGFEPRQEPSKGSVLPLHHKRTGSEGFEPSTVPLTAGCTTVVLRTKKRTRKDSNLRKTFMPSAI